jgi:molybdenum cofactor synthesis domain-containing protein
MADAVITAAMLVIGDEILSGRTKDKNIGHVADYLTAVGIDLREVRIVPDVETEIVDALNALRHRYDHVFTTGGIGPTHDDITADAVAKAFGVSIDIDERAVAMLLERIARADLNEARLRMARIPAGATLIPNSVSKAPGFTIGNVHVMAGVPSIMHAMLDALGPTLPTGRKMHSVSIDAGLREGDIASAFGAVQAKFPDVSMGSYPGFKDGGGFTTTLVLRSRDEAQLAEAAVAVNTMLDEVRASLPKR